MKPCIGLLMMICIACNDPASVDTTQKTDSTQANDTPLPSSSNNDTPAPASFKPGYYTGLLPCADCRNISRRILFLPNHQFHLMDEYIGKEAAPVVADGQWQTDNNQLQLVVNNTVIKRLTVTEKGLAELATGATQVAQRQEGYLTRKTIGADNSAWMEKKTAGIDFFSLGNEPFWLMEIDKDKKISFLQVDNEQPVVFPYVAPAVQNGQWSYTIQNDSTNMQIVISRQFCSDGMSDNWYEYKVDVNYNGMAYMGCGVKLNELPE